MTTTPMLMPGKIMDSVVEQKVMGIAWDEKRCRICGWPLKERLEDGCIPESCCLRPSPDRRADEPAPYSTDLTVAWLVAERIKAKHEWAFTIQYLGMEAEKPWWVGWVQEFSTGSGPTEVYSSEEYGTGDTLAEAICRAGLALS
jgi:ABA sandwich protein